MNMKRIVLIIALVFVLALVAQWAVMAATTTHQTGKQTSKITTHKATKPEAKVKHAPAKKGAGPAIQEVKVKLTEGGFTLEPSNVKAGKVRLVVRNTAKRAMPFEIKGMGIEKKISEIQPGQQRQMTVELKRGDYTISTPGHALKAQAGRNKLVVK